MNSIECLIKRPGGTHVSMGHHAAMQRHYHFRPVSPEDPLSPHVCDVDNDEDYAAFISVREAYRRHKADNAPAITIPSPSDDAPPVQHKNRMDDLLSIDNVGTLSNEWLEEFSRTVLKLDAGDKAGLKALASEYGTLPKGNPSSIALIRAVLTGMIAEQKRASDAIDEPLV